jgi:uncharacterized damage-inducible protein DinB
VLGGGAVAAAGGEQQLEGGQQVASCRLGHVFKAEGEVRGRLGGGGVDEAQLGAAEDQADRDLGVAQQAVELVGGRVPPRASELLGAIERGADRGALCGEIPDQREIGVFVFRVLFTLRI